MASAVQSKKEEVAQHLRAAILTLELHPGADLDEPDLCARFDLSRTPLRDVFRDLAGEGYLSLRPNRGARVADLSHTTLRAFFQAAPMIYGAVLQLAALSATSQQIEALEAAQARFKAALSNGSVAARTLANARFHAITGEMAANPYLLPSFQRLLIDHARIGMTFYRPQTSEDSDRLATASTQHDAIIAAIRARDGALAGRLALDHWDLSRNQIARFVMPGGLDVALGSLPESEPA
ncbi:GntR family transcriptional regulator [Hasllibacter sp. MH4015]|uniref:GntR family transcriptional regulator n=1 Tax=Hasllibacter sp. MH4015 TaxID=2854029 RepID=UPI001CD1CF98|nr:GntR family transcriptional regulator [Hasllibacter sp. MH4015]